MTTKLDRLEECILPLVPKPSRFLSLPGLARPETLEAASARICLVHPGPWESGLASPAVHGLLAAFASAGADADLCVIPDPDTERAFGELGVPLFGLGARRALGDYDLLLVLVDRLIDLPGVLRGLASAGVSARAADRAGAEPLVLLAGEASRFPEPAVPLVDGVLVGDPEAFVPDLVGVLAEAGTAEARRQTARFRLSGMDGVYAPGTPGASPVETVRARWLEALPVPAPPFLYPVAETHAQGAVLEVAREPVERGGAPRLARSVDETVGLAERLVAETGCGELLLTGAASRHPEILILLEDMGRRLSGHGVSVRVDTVDFRKLQPALARELRKGHSFELVFETVGLSERLRHDLGEPLADAGILEAVETARRGGWGAFRFRAWTGLPGETGEDVDAWAGLMEELAVLRNRGPHSPRFFVELEPWVAGRRGGPEPGSGPDVAACQAAAEALRRRLRRHKIRVIERPARAAALESVLRASGREGAAFLEAAAEAGAAGPDPSGAFDVRPWEAAARTAPLAETPAGEGDSRPGPQLDLTGTRTAAAAPVPGPSPSDGAAFGVPAWMGGRRPKRAGRGRETRQSERFRLRFCKDEPLRFSSHLDVTRAFLRAMRRSQLPVALSNGKDRRPRISFGPPLPVGMTSGAEYLDVTFHREVPETFVNSLNQTLIEGLVVVSSAPIRTEPASLNSAIQIAVYEVSFSDTLIEHGLGGIPFPDLHARLLDRVEAAMSAGALSVTRVRGEESRTFNARPSLKRIQVVRDDGGRPALSMTLTLNQPDSVRPELLTSTLVDWADFDERLLRVHRSGLHIPGRKKDLDPLEVVAPGFKWWRQPVRGGTVL